MVAVYSKNLEIYNAEQFKESVSETANSRLFLTFGKVEPWPNDAAPTQANSSVISFNEVWQNMIGAKLITGNDIRHVIRRIDWSANTSYDAYDHCTCSLLLFNPNTDFYVVTSDWNVYKCIGNNNGSISTVMPTSVTTTATVTEADGYIWKYMYTVSPSEQLKYTTADYIPVKTLTVNDNSRQWQVQENAIDGAIEHIKIVNPGQNYDNANNITVTITGDGRNATAIAQVNNQTNTISSIVITDPGSAYTYADVSITSTANGTNATARAMISPTGGHGSDPLRELGGSNLILNVRISGSENGVLPINNQYRQLAVIKDPFLFGTESISSNTVITQLTVLTLNGTSVDYQEDETVYQGASPVAASFTGKVVYWDSANSLIKLSNTTGTPTTDLLVGAISGAARFVDSITNPMLKKYSGQLLYIDNVKPIERAEDQTEDFKIVLKF